MVTEAIGAMTRAILDLPDDLVEPVRDVPDEVSALGFGFKPRLAFFKADPRQFWLFFI